MTTATTTATHAWVIDAKYNRLRHNRPSGEAVWCEIWHSEETPDGANRRGAAYAIGYLIRLVGLEERYLADGTRTPDDATEYRVRCVPYTPGE